MKNKYLKTVALSAFAFFVSLANMNGQDTPFLQFGGKPAQDTAVKQKISFWTYVTKTAWVIQVGPDLVNDNDTRLKEFKLFENRNYYPVHTSAEKRFSALKGKLGLQACVSSESLNPHHFWSTDLNLKYNILTTSIRDEKIFDPYVFLGLGHTYRDFPHGQHKEQSKDNSLNLNVGFGANLWIFKNMGIYAQAVPKWVLFQKQWKGSNYIHFSVGVAFKIGSDNVVAKPVETTVVPNNYHKNKEAEEAAEYLRQILNK